MSDEIHIASLVVYSTPKRVARVAEAVSRVPGACVHAVAPAGKVVVTLESHGADALTAGVASIQRIDGVLSATLVYQCADTLDAMNEEVSDADAQA